MSMFSRRNKFKIFRTVIKFISVDVMNVFKLFEWPAYLLLKPITRNIDLLSIDAHFPVTCTHI